MTPLAKYDDDITDKDSSPAQARSNTTRCLSRKRTDIDAADTADVELRDRSLECSEHFECQAVHDKREWRGQQLAISEADPGSQLSTAAVQSKVAFVSLDSQFYIHHHLPNSHSTQGIIYR